MRIKVDNNKLYLLLIQNNISILPHIACALSESIKKSIFGFASVKLNFSFMLTFVFFQKITATWLPGIKFSWELENQSEYCSI